MFLKRNLVRLPNYKAKLMRYVKNNKIPRLRSYKLKKNASKNLMKQACIMTRSFKIFKTIINNLKMLFRKFL